MTAIPAYAQQMRLFADVPTYTSGDVARLQKRLDTLKYGDAAVSDIYRVERVCDEDNNEWWLLIKRGRYHRGRWQGGRIVERVEIRAQRQLEGVQARFALALCMRGVTAVGRWEGAAGCDGIAADVLRAAG